MYSEKVRAKILESFVSLFVYIKYPGTKGWRTNNKRENWVKLIRLLICSKF